MPFDNQSALAQLGIVNIPIGTTEEVREAGFDIINVASCAKDKKGVVRGCPVFDACRFHHPKLGGFKGQGPKNVGYQLVTDDGGAKGDFMPCFAYTQVLQGRADHGAEQRRQGKRGDAIRIVAQEGEHVTSRYQMPLNAKGEVINQSASDFDMLEAQGIKICRTETMVPATSWGYVKFRRTVPKFPRPNDREGLSYIQDLQRQFTDLDNLDQEVEDEVYTRHRAMLEVAKPLAPAAVLEDLPSAEPIRRGPGRPPKPRDENE